MSTDTKADLEARVASLSSQLSIQQAVIENVIANVMGYDGCHSGKRDFLESCGIDVPSRPNTVVVTVAFAVDWDAVEDADDIVEAVQATLDSDCSAVDGSSAYVSAISGALGAPGDLARGFRATDEMLVT